MKDKVFDTAVAQKLGKTHFRITITRPQAKYFARRWRVRIGGPSYVPKVELVGVAEAKGFEFWPQMFV